AQGLSRRSMKLLRGETANGAIEFEVGDIKRPLTGFEKAVKAVDEASYLLPVEVPVVVVEIVELSRILILRLVVPSLDAPHIGPARRGRVVGAEQVVGAGNPFVEIFLDEPSRDDARLHNAAKAVVACSHVEGFFSQ